MTRHDAKLKSIGNFFDSRAPQRNTDYETKPIMGYEQKMTQKAVMDLTNPQEGEFILDLGCGTARDFLELSKSARCIGLDYSMGMLVESKKNIELQGFEANILRGTALNLSFKDKTFDKVVCKDVIEHIPDWRKALIEMRRVLKHDGLLVITTPNRLSMYKIEQYTIYAAFVFLRNTILFMGKLMFTKNKFFKEREKRSYRMSPQNPYDIWKSEWILRKALKKAGFEHVRSLGICFLPGFFIIRKLPRRLQEMIVSIVGYFEPFLRIVFHRFGYDIGVSARKI